MIRKLLVLALGLIVGGVAFVAAPNADAAQAHSRRAHGTHRSTRQSHHAKRHAAHSTRHTSRKHTARVSHSPKPAGKATHRA